MEDAQNILKKPLILGEFGKPSNTPNYTLAQRDAVFNATFNTIYASAKKTVQSQVHCFGTLLAAV